MALFNKEQKKTTEIPQIAPKAQPMMPEIPASQTMPNPFAKEEQKPITKEINPSSMSAQKDDPFFVRIDKFNQAKDNFEDISKKLNELERLIEKMDDIKQRENKEIEEFKKDTEEIKKTLTEVDKEIFSKL